MISTNRFASRALQMGAVAIGGVVLICSAEVCAARPIQPNTASVGTPQKLVCETQEATGSRLGGKRVCLTREAWAERRLQERQVVERAQAAPCMPTTTSGQGRTAC